MVTQSHRIICFTKVAPNSPSSKPSTLPGRSKQNNNQTHISSTEEEEKEMDLFPTFAPDSQQQQKKKSIYISGLKQAGKPIRMKKHLSSCWESRGSHWRGVWSRWKMLEEAFAPPVPGPQRARREAGEGASPENTHSPSTAQEVPAQRHLLRGLGRR